MTPSPYCSTHRFAGRVLPAPGASQRAGTQSAFRLRAVLDKAASALNKIPLPTSPRIQDFDGGEVSSSLDRFIKSAPEGLMRTGKIVGDRILPVAADMANDLLFKDYSKENKTVSASVPPAGKVDELPAGWTEHTDEETGRTFYYDVATTTTVWERPR